MQRRNDSVLTWEVTRDGSSLIVRQLLLHSKLEAAVRM